MLDPVQKGVELVMINITHQHGIDFDLLKTGLKCSINPRHDLVEFILPGNSVKLAGVRLSTLTLMPVSPASRQFATSRSRR